VGRAPEELAEASSMRGPTRRPREARRTANAPNRGRAAWLNRVAEGGVIPLTAATAASRSDDDSG